MKTLASFQDLYVGLEPYRNDALIGGGVLQSTAPAVFGLLAAIELHPSNKQCGVYAPVGGFRAVTQSLEKLAKELGVHVQCGKAVISVTNEGVTFTDELKSTPEFPSCRPSRHQRGSSICNKSLLLTNQRNSQHDMTGTTNIALAVV